MHTFDNTVGFITGGAAGIGLAVARELGRQGMSLMLVDIEPHTLEQASATLRAEGITVESQVLDVADAAAYGEAAAKTLAHFGKINFLFNNAGVASHAPAGSTPLADWHWVVNVNLFGVVHGVENFLPAMLALDEPCWLVNTASIAGHIAGPVMGPYNATKFAVVGYSESLKVELADTQVGVSVLCPAWVKTGIAESRRNHHSSEERDNVEAGESMIADVIAREGINPEEVAKCVAQGMREGIFNLFTHPKFWPLIEARLDTIRADYQRIL
jgi:NADP-dependent 3-hydroxy acid dehydrogenase YdfG